MIRPSVADAEQEQLAPSASDIHAQAEQQAAEVSAPNEHPSVLLDMLAAPFRGVEDAARSAYNGIDFLTADALPDWKTNFLGKSETTAGAVVENVAEFLTGFIPVVGVAGKAAKAIGLAGKAATIVSGAAAGAFSDFVAFDGHEERLSNLVQQYPQLQNPITDYLAAKPGDGEIEGRFKNSLEGLGVGALVEPLGHALKAMTAVRGAKAGTVGAKAAEKAVSESAGSVKTTLANIRATERETAVAATIKEKPSLSVMADSLSKIDLTDLGGGGLFQAPEKHVSRMVDSPAEAVALLESTSKRIMDDQAASGVARSESMELRAERSAATYAELAGMDTPTMMASLTSNNRSLQHATFVAEAGARVMTQVANEAAYYAKLAAGGQVAPGLQTVEQTMLTSLKAQEILSALVLNTKQSGTIVGRALNARKFIKSAEVQSVAIAKQLVEDFGGSKFVSKELEKVALAGADGNALNAAKGVSDLMRQQYSMGSRVMRVHNEYWINSILSGTKTSFVNMLGNTAATLYQPLEQALGSLLQKDSKAVASSLKNYHFLAQSVQDAWKLSVAALKDNENKLLPSSKVNDLARGTAIDAANLIQGGTATQGLRAEAKGLVSGDGNMLSHFINFVGETTRLPSRMLTAQDEFFKQLNYRAAAKTELHYRGKLKGLEGDALHNYVADNFSNLVTESGAKLSEGAVLREGIAQAEKQGLTGKPYTDFLRDYVDKNYDAKASVLGANFDVTELAQGVAEEATFTRPLGEMGKGIQAFAASHPSMQLLIPFVRTPTNLVKYFAQRGAGVTTFMPGIGRLQERNIAELMSPNALVRSRAQGRIAGGTMMVSVAGIAASEGKITGNGPKDEGEKKLLMETGWQPYSIVVQTADGPHYISYQRLDPFASFFGLIADWAEQAKRQDPMHADTLSTTLTAMATAVSNNVTNKTYLASLTQFLDMVKDPDRKFATWSRARVGSYVPSVMAQFSSSLDDDQTMKEIRGFWDGAANRIPGAQGMLEPKRNVLGEPIDAALAQTPLSFVNPFTLSRHKNDPVFDELAKFNHGLQPPSPITNGNVNLLDHKTASGGTAYNRYQELMGEVEIGGRSMRETLGRLIKSSAYQKLPLTSVSDGLDSPRLGEVKRVINAYRQAALYGLQKEVPSVRTAIRASMVAQIDLRRGDRASALNAVQTVIQAAQ